MKIEAQLKRRSIIRAVTKAGKDGRPKKARDRRSGIAMERVKAHVPKKCWYHKCPYTTQVLLTKERGQISVGTEHAVITQRGVYANFGRFPEARAYHFECVPPEAKPLVRFFK